MAKVKCRYKGCGKEIDKEEAYHNEGSNMYYCCLEHLNSANYNRLHKEQKNYKSVKGTDRRVATDYIVTLFTEKGIGEARIPWDLIGSQMKNLLDEHQDWNYMTLYYIMWYMHDILEMDLIDKKTLSPLNLVPYYYLEAKEYYLECAEINKNINEFVIKDPIVMKASANKQKTRYKKITF